MPKLNERFLSQIKSALILSAFADGVGDPFEFKANPKLSDVTKLIHSNDVVNITDDTQMTLFLFEQFASADHKNMTTNRMFEHIKAAYVNWYITQDEDFPDVVDPEFGLLSERDMYFQRAPGMTCLSACHSLMNSEPVKNNSKGCGSVMRLLPFVYLLQHYDFQTVLKWAVASGHMTHKHDENSVAIELYMQYARYALTGIISPSVKELVETIGQNESIEAVGDGWTALECVEMAIWACEHATDANDLVALAVCHSGDSDSVGAVAGSLYGLNHSHEISLDRIKEGPIISKIIESIK